MYFGGFSRLLLDGCSHVSAWKLIHHYIQPVKLTDLSGKSISVDEFQVRIA